MEGVSGYEFFELLKDIVVTELRINNEVVMVDDPMHWIGMQRLAEACEGKVLIGGLGLGLILHHFINNKKVTSIDAWLKIVREPLKNYLTTANCKSRLQIPHRSSTYPI